MANRIAKGQIVFLCSFTMMILVVLCYLSMEQLRKSNRIRMMDEGIEAQHGISLEIFKTDVDFFGYELNDEEFYKTGKSIYLTGHDSLLAKVRELFRLPINKDEHSDSIEMLMNRYDSAFDKIVEQIRLRGYRNAGLEGSMRDVAHEIENRKLIPAVEYLTLRRYEKDYLLRSDKAYVNKYDSLITQLRTRSLPKLTVELLDKYSNYFHDYVKISDLIGLETQTNLKGRLDKLTKQLIKEIEDRDKVADKRVFESYRQGLIMFAIGIIGSTLLCFTLIIIIAKRL